MLYFNKKDSLCWPRQSKNISKIVRLLYKDPKLHPYRYILSQSRAHIMTINQHKCFTCIFCPQLIRNVRSRRCIDSSSIIAHPVNLQWERSLKGFAKNSTYIYMYMTLLIIDMDFLYQLNLRLIAPLFSFFSWNVWKKGFQEFQKLAGLWLVGEMDNHVGIYGSKVAKGFSALQHRSCLSHTMSIVSCHVQLLTANSF